MDIFENKVINFIERHQLLRNNEHILVGVSGGPDSLALLHFLSKYKEQWGITVSCAHVDHMFRGKESYLEMKYVEDLCKQWNIPFFGTRINVPKEMAKRPGSAESIARDLRYEFFHSVMQEHDIPTLALAHHGDDQIETILMRLTRGTSVGAAAGIRVKRPFSNGFLIRPFLCVTKDEIVAYCERQGLKPVYDATNEMDIYTRNRFRRTILPFLKNENPNVHMQFQRFSEQLAEDDRYLMKLATDLFHQAVKIESDRIVLHRGTINERPISLQRRCIQLILNYLYKEDVPVHLTSIHIDSILELLKKEHPSKKLNLPKGLLVHLSYEYCLFSFNVKKTTPYLITWNKGETITLPNGGQLLMKEKHDSSGEGNDCFYLPKSISFPIYIRTRKKGDRIQLKGAKNQSQKIKDVFINEKVPIYKRDEWPIVTDRDDNILWVPLLKKSIFEAPDNERQEAILLKYKLQNHV